MENHLAQYFLYNIYVRTTHSKLLQKTNHHTRHFVAKKRDNKALTLTIHCRHSIGSDMSFPTNGVGEQLAIVRI